MTNLTKEKLELNTLLSAPTTVTGISIHRHTNERDSATETGQWLSIARREYELFKTRNSKITRFLSNATDFDKAQTDLDQKIRHIRRLPSLLLHDRQRKFVSATTSSRIHKKPSHNFSCTTTIKDLFPHLYFQHFQKIIYAHIYHLSWHDIEHIQTVPIT